MICVDPRIPCRDVQVVPDVQQRCMIISFAMVFVIVVVPGSVFIVDVVSVNIAFFVSIAREIDCAIHTRPSQIPIDRASVSLVEVCRQSSMHAR